MYYFLKENKDVSIYLSIYKLVFKINNFQANLHDEKQIATNNWRDCSYLNQEYSWFPDSDQQFFYVNKNQTYLSCVRWIFFRGRSGSTPSIIVQLKTPESVTLIIRAQKSFNYNYLSIEEIDFIFNCHLN